MDILQFKDISADSPHINNLVKATWRDLENTSINIKRLRDAFCLIRKLENEFATAYRLLSETIRSIIDEDAVCFRQSRENDQLSLQFVGFVGKLSELHQSIAEEMDVCLISKFDEFIELFNRISTESEHLSRLFKGKDASFHSYMKLSKRCGRKLLHTSLIDLAKHKCNFERATAVYYGQMNKASRIREMAPLLVISAFLNSQSGFVNSMNGVFGDTAKAFMEVAQSTLASQLDSENEMTQKFLDHAREVDQRPLISFSPEPWNLEKDYLPEDFPSKPTPNNQLYSKKGHLLIRSRVNLIWRWVDVFCFTQNGSLMSQLYTEIAASLLIDLTQKGVYAEIVDCDDRRNVFEVVSPTEHKTVILQADSEVDRDEWISTLTNIIFDVNSLENRLASARQSYSVGPSLNSRAAPPTHIEATSPSQTACYLPLVPVHLSLPALPNKLLEVADMAQPTSSQVSSEPLKLIFGGTLLGALQFPDEDLAPTCDSVELSHLFSYILSCRTASESSTALSCALHVTDESVWILGQRTQPEAEETTDTALAYSVLAIIPFLRLRNWLICSDNPRLACLSARLPLVASGDEAVGDAKFSGCSCFAVQSDRNNEFSEVLLEALLRRIDVLPDEKDAPEKKALLANIAQLSDAATDTGSTRNVSEPTAKRDADIQ